MWIKFPIIEHMENQETPAAGQSGTESPPEPQTAAQESQPQAPEDPVASEADGLPPPATQAAVQRARNDPQEDPLTTRPGAAARPVISATTSTSMSASPPFANASPKCPRRAGWKRSMPPRG
jgi:hypothetical protein